MPPHERRTDRAQRYARRGLLALGEELRGVRLRLSMSLRELHTLTGVSPAALSRIERRLAPHVAYETLVQVAAAVGLDVPLRAFPNGMGPRDAAQLALLGRLRSLLPPTVRVRSEVTLGIPGDLRAWDVVLEARGWTRPAELECRLGDVQALQRRIRIKCRDAGIADVLLVVADTRHNRHVVRVAADELAEMFPVRHRAALAALRAGQTPTGSAIVLL